MKHTKLFFGVFTITAALAIQVHAQSWLTNGLVAYYPFNGNANDESGNGLNATVHGAVLTTDRFGHTNSAYYLGGSAYLKLPTLSFGSNFTISSWFKFDTLSNRLWQRVFDLGNGVALDNIILCQDGNTGKIGFELDAVTNNTRIDIPFNLRTNLFYNATCVFSNGVDMRLYLNGQIMAQGQMAYNYREGNRTNNFLGKSNWATDSLFKGVLDDIRIYDQALSEIEVQKLYAYEWGPHVNLLKALKPSFDGLALGTNYQLQISGDMKTWTNQGSPFTATDTSMVHPQYFDVDNWNSLYFRLVVSP